MIGISASKKPAQSILVGQRAPVNIPAIDQLAVSFQIELAFVLQTSKLALHVSSTSSVYLLKQFTSVFSDNYLQHMHERFL